MGLIKKFYNYIIYIYSSANRIIWFIECTGKIVPFNNYMRWNSWFLILYIALEDKVKARL